MAQGQIHEIDLVLDAAQRNRISSVLPRGARQTVLRRFHTDIIDAAFATFEEYERLTYYAEQRMKELA